MTTAAPIDVDQIEAAALIDLENIRLSWEKAYGRVFRYTDLCWLCELAEERFATPIGRVVIFMSDPAECEGSVGVEQLEEMKRILKLLQEDQVKTFGVASVEKIHKELSNENRDGIQTQVYYDRLKEKKNVFEKNIVILDESEDEEEKSQKKKQCILLTENNSEAVNNDQHNNMSILCRSSCNDKNNETTHGGLNGLLSSNFDTLNKLKRLNEPELSDEFELLVDESELLGNSKQRSTEFIRSHESICSNESIRSNESNCSHESIRSNESTQLNCSNESRRLNVSGSSEDDVSCVSNCKSTWQHDSVQEKEIGNGDSSDEPFVRLGLDVCLNAQIFVKVYGYKQSGRRRIQRCCDVAIGNEVTKLCFMSRFSNIYLFSADSDFDETARSCAEAEDIGGVIKFAKQIKILGFSQAFELQTALAVRQHYREQQQQQYYCQRYRKANSNLNPQIYFIDYEFPVIRRVLKHSNRPYLTKTNNTTLHQSVMCDNETKEKEVVTQCVAIDSQQMLQLQQQQLQHISLPLSEKQPVAVSPKQLERPCPPWRLSHKRSYQAALQSSKTAALIPSFRFDTSSPSCMSSYQDCLNQTVCIKKVKKNYESKKVVMPPSSLLYQEEMNECVNEQTRKDYNQDCHSTLMAPLPPSHQANETEVRLKENLWCDDDSFVSANLNTSFYSVTNDSFKQYTNSSPSEALNQKCMNHNSLNKSQFYVQSSSSYNDDTKSAAAASSSIPEHVYAEKKNETVFVLSSPPLPPRTFSVQSKKNYSFTNCIPPPPPPTSSSNISFKQMSPQIVSKKKKAVLRCSSNRTSPCVVKRKNHHCANRQATTTTFYNTAYNNCSFTENSQMMNSSSLSNVILKKKSSSSPSLPQPNKFSTNLNHTYSTLSCIKHTWARKQPTPVHYI